MFGMSWVYEDSLANSIEFASISNPEVIEPSSKEGQYIKWECIIEDYFKSHSLHERRKAFRRLIYYYHPDKYPRNLSEEKWEVNWRLFNYIKENKERLIQIKKPKLKSY